MNAMMLLVLNPWAWPVIVLMASLQAARDDALEALRDA